MTFEGALHVIPPGESGVAMAKRFEGQAVLGPDGVMIGRVVEAWVSRDGWHVEGRVEIPGRIEPA